MNRTRKQSFLVIVLVAVVCMVSFISFSLAQTAKQSDDKTTTSSNYYYKPPIKGQYSNESTYKLGKDDVVAIQVRNQPELSGEFTVSPEGTIQYGFIGDIKAENLTKQELKQQLTAAIERYVKQPEVVVTVAAYRSKSVLILGEVGRPGKYPMMGDAVTLREAIITAGLPNYGAALRRVYVITPDKVKPKYRKVDLYKLLYQGKLAYDIALNPEDIVVVSTTAPVELGKALNVMLAPFNRAIDVKSFTDAVQNF